MLTHFMIFGIDQIAGYTDVAFDTQFQPDIVLNSESYLKAQLLTSIPALPCTGFS